MNLEFRIDNEVGPSGVNIALVDVPELAPERNISLIDRSYLWQENVASIETGVIEDYLGADGRLPYINVTDFVVTNLTTTDKKDKSVVPLYYKHMCRFHHYSYGENPLKSVYIADQNDNILKNINYKVSAVRVSSRVYRVEVYTNFSNNEYVQYRVKYNRTDAIGSYILPSWSETINAQTLFESGSPSEWKFNYLLLGPDTLQRYQVQLPLIPAMSELVNSTGTSFDIAPVFLGGHAPTEELYTSEITYTLKALSPNTFSLKRDYTYTGSSTPNIYYNGTAWGATETALSVNTRYVTDGFEVYVYNDNSLVVNDEAYFTASVPYGYLLPTDLRAIYIQKPKNVTAEENWEIGIKNGTFNRRITASGTVEPSGVGGINYKFWVPEYDETYFSTVHGKPYVEVFNERASVLDNNTIKLSRTPVYIDPSDVFNASGFPTSDFLSISINDADLDQTSITDWDTYNGVVTIAETLDRKHDDIRVGYHYRENFYRYPGYLASGVASTEWFPLDLNPTPFHNYGMYASGVVAHIYLSPGINLDDGTIFNTKSVYHNYTGTASGNLDFYLGSVAVYPGSQPKDVLITDTRTRGGGLKETVIFDDLINVQPESEFYWDIGYFDGKAFPSNGVIVVKLPKLLISPSGRFTESEIREKVKKHMALGEYPIIDFV